MMKKPGTIFFFCILFMGLNILSGTTVFAVLPPQFYEKAVESSAIKVIAVVEDIIVLEETNQSTHKKVIFNLERSFNGDAPQKLTGTCYSVDHTWQHPGMGGTIYYYPHRGSRVFVTINSDGGSITSYTRITSQINEELKNNGLKNISFHRGEFAIKNNPLADPISRAMKLYKIRQYKKAFSILEPEALVGHDIAMNHLGHMYFNGLGVEQDYAKAVKWYKRSADQNSPWGDYFLGVTYAQGKGVGKNFKTAFDLFLKAANLGVSKAQYNLGVMYMNGIGVQKNSRESNKWIKLAARQNLPEALDLLKSQGIEKNSDQKNFELPEAPLQASKYSPGTKQLFDALYENDLKTVTHLLSLGIDANSRNDTGQTPLHVTQDLAILNVLIIKGANVNGVDDDGQTPMFNKEIDLLKVLVENGADIHHRTKRGNTLLMWYSYSGYLEGIQYLISLGTDVNAKNKDGQTAFDIAQRFGHFELSAYLKALQASKKSK